MAMMTATVGEMQDNFCEYIGAVMEGTEITITLDGQAIGRFVPQSTQPKQCYSKRH